MYLHRAHAILCLRHPSFFRRRNWYSIYRWKHPVIASDDTEKARLVDIRAISLGIYYGAAEEGK